MSAKLFIALFFVELRRWVDASAAFPDFTVNGLDNPEWGGLSKVFFRDYIRLSLAMFGEFGASDLFVLFWCFDLGGCREIACIFFRHKSSISSTHVLQQRGEVSRRKRFEWKFIRVADGIR